MKKLIPITLIISLSIIILIWFAYPTIENFILKYLVSFFKTSKTIPATLDEKLAIRIKTALSVALVPILSFMVNLIIIKYRNPFIKYTHYLNYTIIILGGYLLGFLIKFLLFRWSCKIADANPIFPGVINTIYLNCIFFYNYGLISASIVGLIVILSTKRRSGNLFKSNNQCVLPVQ